MVHGMIYVKIKIKYIFAAVETAYIQKRDLAKNSNEKFDETAPRGPTL